MHVVQAKDGMAVAPDHVYLIPPGLFLAIAQGHLSLTVPLARHGVRAIFEQAGKRVEAFRDAESFLAAVGSDSTDCCLVVDAALPGISGLQLLHQLAERRIAVPAIMVTGRGDIGTAVTAMKAGAEDFLESRSTPPNFWPASAACSTKNSATRRSNPASATRRNKSVS